MISSEEITLLAFLGTSFPLSRRPVPGPSSSGVFPLSRIPLGFFSQGSLMT